MSGLRTQQRSWRVTVCLAALLTTAAVTLWMFAFMLVVSSTAELLEDLRPPRTSQRQFVFREDGLPVWRTVDYGKGWDFAEYHDLDGQRVKMTKNDEHPRLMTLVDARLFRHPKRATWSSRVTEVTSLQRRSAPGGPGLETWFLRNDGERGFFVAMNNSSRRASGYLGLQGFSDKPPPKSDWFPTFAKGERHDLIDPHNYRGSWLGLPDSQREDTSIPAAAWTIRLFVEPGGHRVHELNFFRRTVRVIHDGEPVLAANLAHLWKEDKTTRAVLRTSDSLRLVELPDDGVGRVEVIPLPENLRRAFALQWVPKTDGCVLVTLQPGAWRLTSLDSAHQVTQERDVANSEAHSNREDLTAITIGLVAFQSPVPADVVAWMGSQEDRMSYLLDIRRAAKLGLDWPEAREFSLSDLVIPLTLLHLTAIGWSVLAVRRLRRFSASPQDQWFWGVWTLLFGVPGYLAFRVHREWRTGGVSPLVNSMRQPELEVVSGTTRGLTPPVRQKRQFVATLGSAYGKCLDAGEHFGADIAARVGFPASYTALVLKECRLAAGIALLACLAYVVVVARLVGLKGFGMISELVSQQTNFIPFVQDGFAQPFCVVGMLLAAGLAVWQSAAESRGEAWLFMLYRPVSRRAVLMSKMLIGLLVVTVCTALPILVYAAWAARPGSVAAPFEWGMTEIAWRQWAALTSIYLGTLLTMLRPARWIGTRLLPAIAVVGWLPGREALGAWCWPVWWELLAVLVINVCLVSSLLLTIREREYP